MVTCVTILYLAQEKEKDVAQKNVRKLEGQKGRRVSGVRMHYEEGTSVSRV